MIANLMRGFMMMLIGGSMVVTVSNLFNGESCVEGCEVEEPKHKQTYIEYVKERLEARKLIHRGL